jgi:formylglycine-generating enzyme required for sulfatase activity
MNVCRTLLIAGLVLCQYGLASAHDFSAPSQAREPFEQKVTGHLVKFKMVPLPDGKITVNGKEKQVKGLWMSETEVTWDLFDIWAFRLDQTPDEQAQGVDAKARPSKPYGAPDRGFGHHGFPALAMTHHAAEEFCQWLSRKTGRKYRLPTEAEWEYAAQAGNAATPELEQVAWFWDNADDKTQPVAKKKANAWGLYDMLGNVAEWSQGEDGKPVVRGGSWRDKRDKVGFSVRALQVPAWNNTDPQNPKSRWWLSDGPFIGIRLVCEGDKP